jgi:hypothetical protein
MTTKPGPKPDGVLRHVKSVNLEMPNHTFILNQSKVNQVSYSSILNYILALGIETYNTRAYEKKELLNK